MIITRLQLLSWVWFFMLSATTVVLNVDTVVKFIHSYTTLTAAFADSAMTPRLILRHRGQTPRLPSREALGHARLAILIYPIKRRVARRSYQINPA